MSVYLNALFQSGGAGLQASAGNESLGRRVLLIGLAAQTLSYLFFVLLIVYSHTKLRRSGIVGRTDYPWFLFRIIYFSSVFILVSLHSPILIVHLLIHVDTASRGLPYCYLWRRTRWIAKYA